MADWTRQRSALLRMRQEIVARLDRSGQYGLDDAMQDEISELSVYDNHPADIGSELFEREKDVALRDMDKLRLQEIDRALAAMDDGVYGVCQVCSRPIPEERLEAYPLSTLCVDCKRADERRHPDRTRPVEEEVLWPGYGRTDLDGQDSVAFDGEDSLQAVWRFNQRAAEGDYDDVSQGDALEDNEGVVDDVERISNAEYKAQIP